MRGKRIKMAEQQCTIKGGDMNGRKKKQIIGASTSVGLPLDVTFELGRATAHFENIFFRSRKS